MPRTARSDRARTRHARKIKVGNKEVIVKVGKRSIKGPHRRVEITIQVPDSRWEEVWWNLRSYIPDLITNYGRGRARVTMRRVRP